jgi:pyruvate,water dikinase
LQDFLEQYGHRELVLSTALQPTWKDDPQIVLGMLKGLAQAEAPAGRGPAEWEVARDRVLAHPWMGFPPLRLAFLRLLAGARRLWELRESSHFEATRVLPTLRRALLEMGARLTQAGALERAEDVFHLKFEELKQAGAAWPPAPGQAMALRRLVQRRKERRDALEGTPVIDPRLYRLPEPQDENAGDVLLHGTPGSPGVAAGPARVIRSAAEFDRLKPGEVLVAPYTNPAWTPLFQRAAAVVVDGGGPGSHAAIVAREYGIPAVMGVVDGTTSMKDGQVIRVDGSRGLVLKEG